MAAAAIAARTSLAATTSGGSVRLRPTKGDPLHKLIGRTWAVLSAHLPPAHRVIDRVGCVQLSPIGVMDIEGLATPAGLPAHSNSFRSR